MVGGSKVFQLCCAGVAVGALDFRNRVALGESRAYNQFCMEGNKKIAFFDADASFA